MVYDLGSKDIRLVKSVPLKKGDIRFSFNPFAPHLVYVMNQEQKNSPMTLIDLEDGRISDPVVQGAKHLHTDSSATYTAIVEPNGEMAVYLHKQKRTIDHRKPIIGVETVHLKQGPVFSVDEEEKSYDLEGNLLGYGSNEYATSIIRFHRESYTKRGSFFIELLNSPLRGPYEHLDPLQRLDQANLYKHTHFELIIDNSDPQNPVAIDPKTGAEFTYTGSIVAYDSSRAELYTLWGESLLYMNTPDGEPHAPWGAVLDRKTPTRFAVTPSGDQFFLRDFTDPDKFEGAPLDENINKQLYSSVTFDGEFFVFVNPRNGDAVYLDPENPGEPVFISAQTPPAAESAPPETPPMEPPSSAGTPQKLGLVTLINEPPPDAPNPPYLIKRNADGTFSIINSITKSSLQSPWNLGPWDRIERVNGHTFICHMNEMHFTQIFYKGEYRLEDENGEKFRSPAIVGYTDQVILGAFNGAFRTLEVGEYLYLRPMEDFISEPELSASGKYSIYRSMNGALVYYDNEEHAPTAPKYIPVQKGQEYLVHDLADVVIIGHRNKNGKITYSLFSLKSGTTIVGDADHIEIDSSGTIAIVKLDGKLTAYELVSGTELVPGAMSRGRGGKAVLKIASDEGSVYFIVESPNLKRAVFRYDKKFNVLPKAQVIEVMDPDDPSLPRLWEFYDFEKKGIWDNLEKKPWVSKADSNRETKAISQRMVYKNNPSTNPEIIVRLSGENAIKIFEYRRIVIDDVPREEQRGYSLYLWDDIPNFRAPPRYDRLESDEVVFIQSRERMESKAIVAVVPGGSFDLKQVFITKSKRFALGVDKDNRVYLISYTGEVNDITEHVAGFVPTDVNGDYFVFVNPETSDVMNVGLKPMGEEKDDSSSISAAKVTPTEQSKRPPTPIFHHAPPADLPNQFEVVQNRDGSYSLFDVAANQNVPSSWRWDKIHRVNSRTYICYNFDRLITQIFHNGDYISEDANGKKIDLRSVKDFTDKMVLGLFSYFSRVLNVDEGPYLGQGDSLSATLTASGQYAIYLDSDGGIRYSNLLGEEPYRKLMIDINVPISEFYIHNYADVILFESPNNRGGVTRLLYSLSLGRTIVENAHHIEIDSSGKLAVVRRSDQGVLEIFDLEKGTRLRIRGSPDQSIEIASDDEHIYVKAGEMVTMDKPDEKVHVFNKKSMEFERFLNYEENKGTLPRFWESFGYDAKTIWDRDGQLKDAPKLGYRMWYGSVNPVEEIYLFGDTLLYQLESIRFTVIDLARRTGVYNIEIKGKHRIEFLRGGKVGYQTLLKPGRGNEEVVLFTRENNYNFHNIWVNESRTLLLGELKGEELLSHVSSYVSLIVGELIGAYFLVDSAGHAVKVTDQIPAGFVPTDVNGNYFVFRNPENPNDFIYWNPLEVGTPAEDLSEAAGDSAEPPEAVRSKEQEARDAVIWGSAQDKVVRGERVAGSLGKSRWQMWVEQARSAYLPFLRNIPEMHRARMVGSFKPLVDRLYNEQGKEIEKRFNSVVAKNLSTSQEIAEAFRRKLENSDLPFDRFAKEMAEIPVGLTVFLSSPDTPTHEEFYKNFFTQLFKIAMAPTLDAKYRPDLFISLGLGYQVQTQDQINDITIVARFSRRLMQTTTHQQASRLIAFLSKVEQVAPSKHKIIVGQIEKLLKLGERSGLLKDFLRSFENLSDDDLETYFEDQTTGLMGKAGQFINFLTNASDPVRGTEKPLPRELPKAKRKVLLPSGKISLSQILALEQMREKQGENDLVMSMRYLEDCIRRHNHTVDNGLTPDDPDYYMLPEQNNQIERSIIKKTESSEVGRQAEEIARDSKDGTRGQGGELVVSYFLQDNDGKIESVERARDNGTGALHPAALLTYEMSTKGASLLKKGEEKESGRYGTGKCAKLQGVERLEIMTRSGQRDGEGDWRFVIQVERNKAQEVTDISLVEMDELETIEGESGVAIDRVKSYENTIPELEQMFIKFAYMKYAGFSQVDASEGGHPFDIFFVDYHGKKAPLSVDKKVLTQVPFTSWDPQTKRVEFFGKLQLLSSSVVEPGVYDRDGFYVRSIQPEDLRWVAEPVRPEYNSDVRRMNISLQIPLESNGGRNGFVRENDFAEAKDKVTAIEWYKAMAGQALQTAASSNRFLFGNFPSDWETRRDDRYHFNMMDDPIRRLAERINHRAYWSSGEHGDYEDLAEIDPNYDLERLAASGDQPNMESRFEKLVIFLEVPHDPLQPAFERRSLLQLREEVQTQIREEREGEERERLQDADRRAAAPKSKPVEQHPGIKDWKEGAKDEEETRRKLEHLEDFIVEERTAREKELKELALDLSRGFGIGGRSESGEAVWHPVEDVILLDDYFRDSAYGFKDEKLTLYISRSLASKVGVPNKKEGIECIATHKILQYLTAMVEDAATEAIKREFKVDSLDDLPKRGIFVNPSKFTNNQGWLGRVKRYASGIALKNHRSIASAYAAPALILAVPLLDPSLMFLSPHAWLGLAIVSYFVSLFEIRFSKKLSSANTETKGIDDYQRNFEKLERQMDSPLFPFFSRLTLASLKGSSAQSQGRVIWIDLRGFPLENIAESQMGENESVIQTVQTILAGAVQGIESDKSEQPTKIGLVLEEGENPEIVSRIAQWMPKEYFLRGHIAHTPQQAVKESQKRGLSIAYVFTLDPEMWLDLCVNLAALDTSMTVRGSAAVSLMRMIKKDKLYRGSVHWNEHRKELTIDGREFGLEQVEDLWKAVAAFKPHA